MAEFIPPQFRLITSSRGSNKLVENAFMYVNIKYQGTLLIGNVKEGLTAKQDFTLTVCKLLYA